MRFLDRASFACLPPTVAPHLQITLVEAAAVSTVAAHECGTGVAGRPRCLELFKGQVSRLQVGKGRQACAA